ncbi:hypothetical protein PIB30_055374 [Stylosanthes scabra]|uniref:Uncharacterized protein n=1 Tax=Stylosanthes scabra TaxID=79078 RepID=A0ABU6QJF7_9FABA|nr:hypothetical protein [Stylosanthes scabra]
MQKSQADYMEEVKQLKEKQEQIYNHNQRFHSQIWQEQEKLAKEIQEARNGEEHATSFGEARKRKNEERKLEEQEKRNLEHSARAPTPRPKRPKPLLRAKPSTPWHGHQRLGVAHQLKHLKDTQSPRLGVLLNA